jgi:TolA-binding protein
MLRWWLALILTVVSTTAWAQPAEGPGAQAVDPRLAAATRRAQDLVTAVQRYASQLAAQREALRQRLNEQLVAIDRLKRGPRGWRTKSQLEERLSEANETQKQLEAADVRLGGAQRRLAAVRAGLVAAIDAELRAGVAGGRARSLWAMRRELTPRSPARRIVLPDTNVDPWLDPEELVEQVAAITQVEAELERQIRGLEARADELQKAHDLRQQHARTLEVDRRDDNSSRRSTQQPSGGRTLADAAAPPSGPPESAGAMFESDAPTVLPEVVDPAVLDGIHSAQRSGDLSKRAAAVRNARDAVARRLADLRAKRAAIQGLAKQPRPR